MLYKKLQLLGDLRQLLSKQARPVAYIAGKVSDLPLSDVQAKFAITKGFLEAEGYTVLNPMELIKSKGDWQFDMRMCMALIGMADTVYMQADWEDSTGAKIEFELAGALGIPVIFEEDGAKY